VLARNINLAIVKGRVEATCLPPRSPANERRREKSGGFLGALGARSPRNFSRRIARGIRYYASARCKLSAAATPLARLITTVSYCTLVSHLSIKNLSNNAHLTPCAWRELFTLAALMASNACRSLWKKLCPRSRSLKVKLFEATSGYDVNTGKAIRNLQGDLRNFIRTEWARYALAAANSRIIQHNPAGSSFVPLIGQCCG